MTIEDLTAEVERTIIILRHFAGEETIAGNVARAHTFNLAARNLKRALGKTVTAETPAASSPINLHYLTGLQQGLGHPNAWIPPQVGAWIVHHLLECCDILPNAIECAEITGDYELVAKMQLWIRRAREGPAK